MHPMLPRRIRAPLTPVSEMSPNLDGLMNNNATSKASSSDDSPNPNVPNSEACTLQDPRLVIEQNRRAAFQTHPYKPSPEYLLPLPKSQTQADSLSAPNLLYSNIWSTGGSKNLPRGTDASSGESSFSRDEPPPRPRAISELPQLGHKSFAASRAAALYAPKNIADEIFSTFPGNQNSQSRRSSDSPHNSNIYRLGDNVDIQTAMKANNMNAYSSNVSLSKSNYSLTPGSNTYNSMTGNIPTATPDNQISNTAFNFGQYAQQHGQSPQYGETALFRQPSSLRPAQQHGQEQTYGQTHQYGQYHQNGQAQHHEDGQVHRSDQFDRHGQPQQHFGQSRAFGPPAFQHDMAGRQTPGGVSLPQSLQGLSLSDRPTDLHVNTRNQPTNTGVRDWREQSTNSSNTDTSNWNVNAPPFNIYYDNPQTVFGSNDYGLAGSPDHLGSAEAVEPYHDPAQPSVQDITSSMTPHQVRAKRLAAFIRSGGLEQNSGPTPKNSARQFISRASSSTPGSRSASVNSHPQTAQIAPMTGYQAAADPVVEALKAKGGPTWLDITTVLPFVEKAIEAKSGNYGVIKLTDIPFDVTKQEIVAVLGERARLVKMPPNSGSYAIHIIMERSTAKSMEAYVEFEDHDSALMESTRLSNSKRLIGSRKITTGLSSQAELMKELFPRAKCIQWHGPNPVFDVEEDTEAAKRGHTGFKFFLSSEEMYTVTKIASAPNRYQFASRHPQRTYESMISVMAKYPWSQTHMYTLRERNYIAKCVIEQIGCLADHITRRGSHKPLDQALLHDYLRAALQCPGFSEMQRSQMIDASSGIVPIDVFVTPLAKDWPCEAVGIRDLASTAMVSYMLDLIRTGLLPDPAPESQTQAHPQPGNATAHVMQYMSLAEASRLLGPLAGAKSEAALPPFKIEYPANKDDLSMQQIACIEWVQVEQSLRKVVRA